MAVCEDIVRGGFVRFVFAGPVSVARTCLPLFLLSTADS